MFLRNITHPCGKVHNLERLKLRVIIAARVATVARFSFQQWNAPEKQAAAAIAALGLSLAGWLVDWAAGGIQQDRVFFVAGPEASNLVGQVFPAKHQQKTRRQR